MKKDKAFVAFIIIIYKEVYHEKVYYFTIGLSGHVYGIGHITANGFSSSSANSAIW